MEKLKLSKKQYIGSLILVVMLFVITNLEWHSFELFVKVTMYDAFTLLGVLLIMSVCALSFNDVKSKWFAVLMCIGVVLTVVFQVKGLLAYTLFTWTIVMILLLSFKMVMDRILLLVCAVWMGVFFPYWTIDVKGYFKGYDTYYGSVILFLGFIFLFIVFEYIKFCLNTSKSDKKIIKVLSDNSYLLGIFEAGMVVWAYMIMSWYQSVETFYITLLFVVLIILPYEVSPYRLLCIVLRREYKHNYLCNISVSAIISYFVLFITSKNKLLFLTMPFALSFVALCATYRYFRLSGESEEYHVYDSVEYRKGLKNEWLLKGGVLAIATLAALIPNTILGALENYYPNIREMEFPCSAFFSAFVGITLAAALIAFAVGIILREKTLKLICTIVFYIGVAQYIQVMFLNKHLSNSNGSRVDFSELSDVIRINNIQWLAILIVITIAAIALKDKYKYMILFAGGALCAVQIVAAISLPFSFESWDRSGIYKVSANNQFELATDENIIVFILDTVGNHQLNDALAEYPDLLDGFEDFTRYDNADCCYSWTCPSLTHMFTGAKLTEDTKSLDEWNTEVWNSERAGNIFDTIHNAGYSVDLYTGGLDYPFGKAENLIGKFDNLTKYKMQYSKRNIMHKMRNFSLYKTMPYCMKEKYQTTTDDFYDITQAIVNEGEYVGASKIFTFCDRILADGLSVNDSVTKSIKIHHMTGTHEQDENINENLERDGIIGPSRSLCAHFKLLKIYIDEMKRLGKYDDATIIITADHGTYIDVVDPQPILFVKHKGDSFDSIKVTNAPVSHCEFMPTILKYAGIDYSEYGQTYEDFSEDESRVRDCGYLSPSHDMSYYTYSTDGDELMEKFPDSPDYSVHVE